MANHKLTNKKLLKELGICNMSTYLKLRRSRWLGKLSHMNNKIISHLLLGKNHKKFIDKIILSKGIIIDRIEAIANNIVRDFSEKKLSLSA